MRNTMWMFNNDKKSIDLNKPKYVGIDSDITDILASRGITDKKSIFKFLHPDIDNISDPFDLKDMDIAVSRILQAIKNKEKIWIYGDYDVDGITSTSLLYMGLSEIGADIEYYIPLREEGYGLNTDAIDKITKKHGNLIVTVDCGISSVNEIKYCNEKGMDIIITDHHEINNELPPAYAVINPKRTDNTYKFKYLAGVGTAFMLLLALFKRVSDPKNALKYLDIVAIGTVADIVPLIEENRIFVKNGLENIGHGKSKGLNLLIRTLFQDHATRVFSTYDVGFVIAPMFNAVGRLEDAKKAVELFLAQDPQTAQSVIDMLKDKNNERKEIQERIYQDAIKKIKEENIDKDNILIIGDESYHHGVIGIVASKILEQYYRPVIVYEIKKDDGIAVASCRSIEDFDITAALTKFSDMLMKYGGHSGAAGFSISLDKLEEFKKKMIAYANENITQEDMNEKIHIECELPFYKISYDFLYKISLLEPFGAGNPTPLFAMKDCKYTNMRLIGKDKTHLMFNLIKDGYEIRNCVWFGGGDRFEDIKKIDNIDVVFRTKLEEYNGKYQCKLFISDIKESKKESKNALYDIYELYNIDFPIKIVIDTRKKISDGTFDISRDETGLSLLYNRSKVSDIDQNTSYVLSTLQDRYGYKYLIKCDKIIETYTSNKVFLSIYKNTDFISYSIRPGEVFNEIKDHLIGHKASYNTIEKKVLSTIFKDNKNVLAVIKKGRGRKTIIHTICLYFKNMNKKTLLITKDLKTTETVEKFVETSPKIKKGYDFYIIYKDDGSNIDILSQSDMRYLVISEKDVNIISQDVVKIVDEYDIPTKVEMINNKNDIKDIVFVDFLPIELKEKLLRKMQSGEKILATKDIIPYL